MIHTWTAMVKKSWKSSSKANMSVFWVVESGHPNMLVGSRVKWFLKDTCFHQELMATSKNRGSARPSCRANRGSARPSCTRYVSSFVEIHNWPTSTDASLAQWISCVFCLLCRYVPNPLCVRWRKTSSYQHDHKLRSKHGKPTLGLYRLSTLLSSMEIFGFTSCLTRPSISFNAEWTLSFLLKLEPNRARTQELPVAVYFGLRKKTDLRVYRAPREERPLE